MDLKFLFFYKRIINVFGFPQLNGKESTYNTETSLIPGWRSLEKG